MTFLTFTPVHALVGGMSLGTLAAGKTLITGRILGISGSVKGMLNGDMAPWRVAFVGGLVASGVLGAYLMPGAFETLPSTYTVARAALAGLAVGTGASLGNGCTSGHGVSGNARLSLRSLVYTATFFVAGMAAVAATDTMGALQIAGVKPPYVAPTSVDMQRGLAILAASIAGTVGLGAAAQTNKQAAVVYEGFAGLMFGLGLCFSSMTRPSAVASALAAFQPAWNTTLMFVMGGAVAVAMPLFQFVIKKRKTTLTGEPLALPSNRTINWQLIAGGVLFGVGWGAGGLCPGPAIVALARPQIQVVANVAGMLVGLVLPKFFWRAKKAVKESEKTA